MHPSSELEGVDPLSSRVFEAFRRTVKLHRQLMIKTLGGKVSHPGQAVCLRLLASKDGTSQRDLADALHLSRPRVTAIVQTLETAGAVVRRPDQDDQRLMRVYLTEEGRRLEKVLRSHFARFVDQTIGSLSESDCLELERILDVLAESTARFLEEEKEQPEL